MGVKPFVADKNRSRMEDRILKESQTVKEVMTLTDFFFIFHNLKSFYGKS